MHDIGDFIVRVMVGFIGLLLTVAGFLIHLVLSNVEARIKDHGERLDRLENAMADTRVEIAEARGRSNHD